MRKLSLVIISLAALHFTASANATVIDFSAYPENTWITDQFAAEGVTFRAMEEGVEVPNVTANFPSTTGDTYLSNCYPTRCDQRADVVEVFFASPASNVSWGLDSEGGLQITFNAYDAGDVLLETFSAAYDGETVGFTVDGISRIEMLQPDDGWGWGFANLTFDNFVYSPVPTMTGYGAVLLALGLLLFAAYRLRASGRRI